MDNTISYYFTLLICGGPCQLPSFKQCSWTLFPLRTACSHGKKFICQNWHCDLMNMIRIKILSLNLFSKAT